MQPSQVQEVVLVHEVCQGEQEGISKGTEKGGKRIKVVARVKTRLAPCIQGSPGSDSV